MPMVVPKDLQNSIVKKHDTNLSVPYSQALRHNPISHSKFLAVEEDKLTTSAIWLLPSKIELVANTSVSSKEKGRLSSRPLPAAEGLRPSVSLYIPDSLTPHTTYASSQPPS
jgi:hypothetical protein